MLAYYLAHSEDKLRADFQQFYNIDIDTIGSSEVSARKAACLAAQLPDTARVVKSLSPINEWTVSDYLLAQLVDNTSLLLWQNSEDGAKGRNMPKPIPRPSRDEEDDKAFALDIDGLNNYLYNRQWKEV